MGMILNNFFLLLMKPFYHTGLRNKTGDIFRKIKDSLKINRLNLSK